MLAVVLPSEAPPDPIVWSRFRLVLARVRVASKLKPLELRINEPLLHHPIGGLLEVEHSLDCVICSLKPKWMLTLAESRTPLFWS